MDIEYDQDKRNVTLRQRGLDFTDASKVFAGVTVTIPDKRHDYGENRYMTVGMLAGRVVCLGVDSA